MRVGVAVASVTAAMALVAAALLAWMGHFQPFALWPLQTALWLPLTALLPLAAALLAAGRRAANPAAFARDLDRGLPAGAADPFRTWISLPRHPRERWPALEAMLASCELKVSRSASPWRLLGWTWLPALAMVGTVGTLVSDKGEWWRRLATPGKVLAGLPRPTLEWISGRTVWAVGDTLEVRLRVRDLPPGQTVRVTARSEGEVWRQPMVPDADGRFLFRHGPLAGNLTLVAEAGTARSRQWSGEAVPPPALQGCDIRRSPPGYTGLEPDTLRWPFPEGKGLAGSRIEWVCTATEPLASWTWTRTSPGGEDSAETTEGTGKEMTGSWVLSRSETLRLEFVSAVSGSRRGSGPHAWTVIPDRPPEIDWAMPREEVPWPAQGRLEVAFRYGDDYGMGEGWLEWRAETPGMPPRSGKLSLKPWAPDWDVAPSGLGRGIWTLPAGVVGEGGILEVTLVATDRDTVSGPQEGRSRTLRLRRPTLGELQASLRAGEEQAVSGLRSATQREKELESALRKALAKPEDEGPPLAGEAEVDRLLGRELEARWKKFKNLAEEGSRTAEQRSDAPGSKAPNWEPVRRLASKPPVPPSSVRPSELPLERQIERAERAAKAQEKMVDALRAAAADPARREAAPLEGRRQNLEREAENAAKDLQALHSLLADRKREEDFRAASLERAAKESRGLGEEMERAREEIRELLRQGEDSGMLSPDLLEKMERVEELMSSALDDDLRRQLAEAAGDKDVGLEQMRDRLEEWMGDEDGLRRGLEQALAMLENLALRRELNALAQNIESLRERQEPLGSKAEPGERAAELQDSLAKAWEEMRSRALENLSGRQAADLAEALRSDAAGKAMAQAEKEFRKQGNAPSPSSSSSSAGRGQAQAAAAHLASLQSQAENLQAALAGGPDPARITRLAEEVLAYARDAESAASPAALSAAGWMGGVSGFRSALARAGSHLARQAQALAKEASLNGEILGRTARAWERVAGAGADGSADPALMAQAARESARELLKLLDAASGGGSGSSSGGSGGGGSGQGPPDLSGALQGLSGEQMAVNRATQSLLQSYLQGRRGGAGGGESPSGEGKNGNPNSGSGSESGSAASQSGPGGSAARAAEAQAGLAESLDRLAEGSDDAGGAAARLRALAAEARALEAAIRKRQGNAEDIERRQERFQGRLLETARALEEKGEEKTREASRPTGPGMAADPWKASGDAEWLEQVREKKRQALLRAKDRDEKSLLERYYRELETR